MALGENVFHTEFFEKGEGVCPLRMVTGAHFLIPGAHSFECTGVPTFRLSPSCGLDRPSTLSVWDSPTTVFGPVWPEFTAGLLRNMSTITP